MTEQWYENKHGDWSTCDTWHYRPISASGWMPFTFCFSGHIEVNSTKTVLGLDRSYYLIAYRGFKAPHKVRIDGYDWYYKWPCKSTEFLTENPSPPTAEKTDNLQVKCSLIYRRNPEGKALSSENWKTCDEEPNWLTISNYSRKSLARLESYSPN